MSRAATNPDIYKFDGWQSVSAGMDSSKTPDLIESPYAALLVNTTVRGGKPTNRPGFTKLNFVASGTPEDIEIINQVYRYGHFLGGTIISDPSVGKSYILAVYSGRILQFDLENLTIWLLTRNTGGNGYLDPRLRCYFCQVEEYAIIQNGKDIPFIYNIKKKGIRRSFTGSKNPKLNTVTSITRSGTVVTLTYSTLPMFLLNWWAGVLGNNSYEEPTYLEVQGVSPEEYEGNFYVTGWNPTILQYDIGASTATTPATIDPAITYIRAVPEVPIGTFMTYGQGRLFVASPNRTEFLAGDIITGDVNGTNMNALRFSETQYLAEGGSFRLPATMGEITGMTVIPFQDTSTGQGELFVMGEYGVGSFNVSLPRASVVNPQTFEIITPGWKDAGIQKVVLTKTGCTSPESITSYNGDIMWRSQIGIRSYRNARAEHNNYGVTPISAEMNRILNADPKDRLFYVSSESFNNRMLTTCAPVYDTKKTYIQSITNNVVHLYAPLQLKNAEIANATFKVVGGPNNGIEFTASVVDNYNQNTKILTVTGETTLFDQADVGYLTCSILGAEIYHRGLTVLDFTSVSGVGGKSTPAWDGVWTGLNIQHIAGGVSRGKERCFIFSFDDGGRGFNNGIWEITEGQPYDYNGEFEIPITSTIETKAFRFDSEFSLKQLQTLSLWISKIVGEVEFFIQYRPDNYPCWVDWDGFKRCADVEVTEPMELYPIFQDNQQALPQSRSRVDIATPADTPDPTTSGLLRNFYTIQLRISWQGKATIDKGMIVSLDKKEHINSFVLNS